MGDVVVNLGTAMKTMKTPKKTARKAKKDGRIIPYFAPGPDGGPSAEEQAWADAEQREVIMPRVKAQRDADGEEEAANYAAKLERNAARVQRDRDWRDQIDARMKAIEEKAPANG